MKSSVIGCQPLCDLAEELIDVGIPVDVVNLDIEEKVVPRTDKGGVCALIEAYGDGDLVIPLGSGSGLIALEVDEANGGTESLRALIKDVEIPRTPIIKTSAGLFYILMRSGKTPRVSREVLGSGLALVANERLVVVPPKDDPDRSNGWWKNFPATPTEVAIVPEKLANLV